jgi:thiosulfate reductase cytochrome b subunit
LGGYDFARYVHFVAMAAIVGFLLIHVIMAFVVPALRAMIVDGEKHVAHPR